MKNRTIAVLLVLLLSMIPIAISVSDCFDGTTSESESNTEIKCTESGNVYVLNDDGTATLIKIGYEFVSKEKQRPIFTKATYATSPIPMSINVNSNNIIENFESSENTVEGRNYVVKTIGGGDGSIIADIKSNVEPVELIPGTKQIKYALQTGNCIDIPGSVTDISANAFVGAQTKIAGGAGIEHIGVKGFSSSWISDFDFPKLETIGDQAFEKCKSLKGVNISQEGEQFEIIIPDTTTSIGKDAFRDAGKDPVLFSIHIGKSLSAIGDGALDTKVKNITVDSENSNFFLEGNALYMRCSDGNTLIAYAGYADNASTVLEINKDVKTIRPHTFTLNSNLTNITFSTDSKLETIMGHAFYQNELLTAIDLPKSLRLIDEFAFTNCNIQEVTLKNIDYNDADSVSLKIADNAFIADGTGQKYKNITKVIFEEKCNIEYIGSNAFHNKFGDNSLIQFGNSAGQICIPSSVSYIGSNAFSPTVNKISFGADSKIQVINEGTFYNSGAGVVDLSNCSELVAIKDDAFYGLGKTWSDEYKSGDVLLTFPKVSKIDEIGNGSFNAFALSHTNYVVNLPSSVVSVGNSAFNGMTSLTVLEGSLLETIGLGAFNFKERTGAAVLDLTKCLNLKNITNPGNNVDTIKFPAGVLLYTNQSESDDKTYLQDKSNGEFAFASEGTLTITPVTKAISLNHNNAAIDSIVFDSEETNPLFEVVDGALYMSGKVLVKTESAATKFIVKESVETIASYAFVGCNDLREVWVSNNGMKVGSSAFDGCSNLAAFVTGGIPENIAMDAFGDCSKLNICLKPGTSLTDYERLLYTNFGPVYGGLNAGTNAVYLSSEVPIKGFDYSNGNVIITFSGGYSSYDVDVRTGVSLTPVVNGNCGSYPVELTSDTVVYVIQKDRNHGDVNVIFDSNGGSFGDDTLKIVSIPKGMTLIDSDLPLPMKESCTYVWMNGGAVYDFDTPVNNSITIYASWSDRNPSVVFESELCKVNAIADGKTIDSGSSLKAGTLVTINFVPVANYEFIKWKVTEEKSVRYVKDTELTLELSKDTVVTPTFRYYQLSDAMSGITNIPSMPTYSDLSDNLALQWTAGGYVYSKDGEHVWRGGVSVPLIVDDYVYIRQGDGNNASIYKIESDTGYIVSTSGSIAEPTFYHTLGYGGGLIVDYNTGNVLDLDLESVFKLDKNVDFAYYYLDSFYTMIDGSLYKFDTVDEDTSRGDNVKNLEYVCDMGHDNLGNYGLSYKPVFLDGFMYSIYANKNARGINSVDLNDPNHAVRSIELDGISGHLFDDGLLTYHNGRIYLTSYTTGLFGDRMADGQAKITSVKVDNGVLSDPKYMDVRAGDIPVYSILSQFVIFEGRGYVNGINPDGKAYMMVYDVKDNGDLSQIYYENSVKSHGSIVVNTSEANELNGNAVSIYVVPYAPSSDLYVFSDNAMKDTASVPLVKKLDKKFIQYCSQGVRVGANGEMIWYNDSGQLLSYALEDSNTYYFLIKDGDKSRWVSGNGANASEAFANSGYGYASMGAIKAKLNSNDQLTDDWSLYVYANLNTVDKSFKMQDCKWNLISDNNMVEKGQYHYWIISKQAETPNLDGTHWMLVDGSVYKFQNNVGDRSVVGKLMSVTSVSKHTVTVDEVTGGQIQVAGDSTGFETGSKVLISIVPDEGKKIKSVVCSGATVRFDYDVGSYCFIMPNADVSVSCTFVSESAEVKEYSMNLASSDVIGSNVVLNLDILRVSGDSDINDPRLLVISKYDGGMVVNVYSSVRMLGGTADENVVVSTQNLDEVHVYLVSGVPLPGEEFIDYGSVVYKNATA